MDKVTKELRQKLSEYRYARIGQEVSLHVNAVDISLSLVELAINDGRAIQPNEEAWFRAGYYLDHVFGGSEWEIIHSLYYRMVEEVEKRDFFR